MHVLSPYPYKNKRTRAEKASGNPNRLPAAFRETRTKITTSRHTLQQHFTIGLFPLSVTALFFFLFFFFLGSRWLKPASNQRLPTRHPPDQNLSRAEAVESSRASRERAVTQLLLRREICFSLGKAQGSVSGAE